MNFKRELIALVVRTLADNTSLIRKPSEFETFLSSFMGDESYDRRIAADLEVEADRVLASAKSINLRRKFNKITKHI